MKPYVLVLDHGTTGVKACLMDRDGQIVARGYEKVPQIYPQPGWVEHDPMVLWEITGTAVQAAFAQVKAAWKDIDCIGITNQRETTILWDKNTGAPVHNAIVWQCRRTAEWCDEHKHDLQLVHMVQQRTGLVLDAYFSATKIVWMLLNCPETKRLTQQDRLLFGTVDTWLLWMLTGGKVHATDYTNASRTMLYNIQNYTWDHELLEVFEIPDTLLPDVFPTSGHFGTTDPRVTGGVSIPVMSMVGDQQSALYGQKCWRPGNCKNTFGTGAFLMMNLGDQFLLSSKGLLTTIACDPDGKPAYALEGAVFIAGAALEWLKDQMGMISTFEEADKLAKSIKTNEGVYMVPAFVGLGAPYWRGDVRGTMSGLTQGTTRAHFARAALESMAYQSDDVVTQMQRTARMSLEALKVDGGVTRSNFLMQFLANLIDVPVQRMSDPDLTAKGAGFLAGLASGFWRSSAEIEALPEEIEEFKPKMNEETRRQFRTGWQQAIYKTLAVEIKLDEDDDEASEEESQEQMVI